jgi:hypothetical protein
MKGIRMTKGRILPIRKNVLGFVLGILLFCPSICSAGDLELSVGLDRGGQCVKSPDRTILVKHQPMSFCVTLTNRSGSSQSVYWQVEVGGIASLSFELTNEQGQTVVVKRKKMPVRSAQVLSNYLAAGASITKTILADPDNWDNLPVIEPGKVKTFKARAVFDNDDSNIYSQYYQLVLDGR